MIAALGTIFLSRDDIRNTRVNVVACADRPGVFYSHLRDYPTIYEFVRHGVDPRETKVRYAVRVRAKG